MEVSIGILDFLTGVHGDRNNQNERKGTIFNRAFEQAYKDMATHTVAYKKDAKEKYVSDDSKRCNENKMKIRNAIKKYVSDNIFDDVELSTLLNSIDTQEKFNDWHKSACKSLVKIDCIVDGLEQKEKKIIDSKPISELICHTDRYLKYEGVFTYGQAQKLINMMVKYLYIFYQCEGWSDLDKLKECAHVPIDSYVLKEVFGKDVYNGTPWSKIISYGDYMECKKEIDKKASGYPFLWELANWPFNS